MLFSFLLKVSSYFIKYKFKKIKRIATDICTPKIYMSTYSLPSFLGLKLDPC